MVSVEVIVILSFYSQFHDVFSLNVNIPRGLWRILYNLRELLFRADFLNILEYYFSINETHTLMYEFEINT